MTDEPKQTSKGVTVFAYVVISLFILWAIWVLSFLGFWDRISNAVSAALN